MPRVWQESCCGGQHTYAHAQQMLTALGRHPRGTRFRRLAQELEAHAAAAAGPVVWQMARWCVCCRLCPGAIASRTTTP